MPLGTARPCESGDLGPGCVSLVSPREPVARCLDIPVGSVVAQRELSESHFEVRIGVVIENGVERRRLHAEAPFDVLRVPTLNLAPVSKCFDLGRQRLGV